MEAEVVCLLTPQCLLCAAVTVPMELTPPAAAAEPSHKRKITQVESPVHPAPDPKSTIRFVSQTFFVSDDCILCDSSASLPGDISVAHKPLASDEGAFSAIPPDIHVCAISSCV